MQIVLSHHPTQGQSEMYEPCFSLFITCIAVADLSTSHTLQTWNSPLFFQFNDDKCTFFSGNWCHPSPLLSTTAYPLQYLYSHMKLYPRKIILMESRCKELEFSCSKFKTQSSSLTQNCIKLFQSRHSQPHHYVHLWPDHSIVMGNGAVYCRMFKEHPWPLPSRCQ